MTGTLPPTAPVARPRAWMRWLLIASLALNLAIAGLVAGAVVRARHMGPPHGFDLAIGPIARALAPEDRRWIMRDLAGNRALPARDPAARRAEMRALLAAVTAQPFDPAAVAAALETQRSGAQSLQIAAETALVARLATMSPEARAAFAARLSDELARDRRDDPARP